MLTNFYILPKTLIKSVNFIPTNSEQFLWEEKILRNLTSTSLKIIWRSIIIYKKITHVGYRSLFGRTVL